MGAQDPPQTRANLGLQAAKRIEDLTGQRDEALGVPSPDKSEVAAPGADREGQGPQKSQPGRAKWTAGSDRAHFLNETYVLSQTCLATLTPLESRCRHPCWSSTWLVQREKDQRYEARL